MGAATGGREGAGPGAGGSTLTWTLKIEERQNNTYRWGINGPLGKKVKDVEIRGRTSGKAERRASPGAPQGSPQACPPVCHCGRLLTGPLLSVGSELGMTVLPA